MVHSSSSDSKVHQMLQQRPDFVRLCENYPELHACASKRRRSEEGKSSIPVFDFKDEHVLRTLTTVLFKDQFNLDVVLPLNRLTPPLPNRVNYLRWLRDLLNSTNADDTTSNSSNNNIRSPHILDIGVGASCVYPLLGHRMFGWQFTGIDIDNESLQCAMDNVVRNHFSPSAVTLRLVERCDVLQQALSEELGLEQTIGKPGTKRKRTARPITTALLRISQPSTASSSSSSSFSSDGPMVCFDNEHRGPIRRALLIDIDQDHYKDYGLHKDQEQKQEQEQNIVTTCYRRDCVLACEETFLRCSHLPTSPASSYSFVPSENPEQSAVPVSLSVLYPPGCLYSAVMTNPPFYDTTETICPSHRTVCTGAVGEMITTGGEVGFVAAIIADSLVLRDRIGWYTAMLGKKHSLKVLVGVLKAEGVRHVVTTVFQGQGTVPGVGSESSLVSEQEVVVENGEGGDGGNDDDDDDDDEKKQGPDLGQAQGPGPRGVSAGGGRTRRWGIAWSFLPSPLEGNKNMNGAINPSPPLSRSLPAHHPPSKTAPQPNNRRMRRLLAATAKCQPGEQVQDQSHGQGLAQELVQGLVSVVSEERKEDPATAPAPVLRPEPPVC